MKDVSNDGSADIDLPSNVGCVANLAVAPGEVVVSDPDDEITDLFRFGWAASLPHDLTDHRASPRLSQSNIDYIRSHLGVA